METLLLSLGPTTSTLAEDLLVNATIDYFTNPISTTCSETSRDCVIDHSVVCVGEVEYCNLTKDEYELLLYDYISPTIPEWILIFSHIIVFLMGLVSHQLTWNFYCSQSTTNFINWRTEFSHENVKHHRWNSDFLIDYGWWI